MIRIFRRVLQGILIAVAAGLGILFVLPRLFGYTPYTVVSASMQQSFPVGSLIYVRAAVPEEIEVGDPITFVSGSLVITHRVVAIDSEQRIFTTKGDSNNASELTPFENLRGKALNFSLPGVGYAATWFNEPLSKLIVAINLLSMTVLSMALEQLEDWLRGEDETPEAAAQAAPVGRERPVTPAPPAVATGQTIQMPDRNVGTGKEGETVDRKTRTQTERVFRPAEIRHPARGNARFNPRRKEQ